MEDERFDMFIKIIQKSVEKNGPDYPLTLGHLNNIIKKVDEIHQSVNNDYNPLNDSDWMYK